MEADSHPEYERASSHMAPKKKTTKEMLAVVAALVLIAGSSVGAYMWRDQQAQTQIKEKESKIDSLLTELAKTKADLRSMQEKSKKADSDAAAAKAAAAAAKKAKENAITNLKDSVTSRNYAAAASYMADTVRVILAASEGMGDRTPAQAASDMAYLNSGVAPWDFDLPAAELAGYRAGDYAAYFPADALVGKSSNNYLVSFTFNASGKVSGVFISGTTDIL